MGDVAALQRFIDFLGGFVVKADWSTEDGKSMRDALLSLPSQLQQRLAQDLLKKTTLSKLLTNLPWALHQAIVAALVKGKAVAPPEPSADSTGVSDDRLLLQQQQHIQTHVPGNALVIAAPPSNAHDACGVADALQGMVLQAVLLQLPQLPSLTAVVISKHQLGTDGVTAAAQALQACTHLTCVDLSGNNAGEAGLDAIGAALHTWPGLRMLLLSDNADDKSQYHCADGLAHGLAHVKRLQVLDITRSIGMCALMQQAIAALPDLMHLQLEAPLVQEDELAFSTKLTCLDFGQELPVISEMCMPLANLKQSLRRLSSLRILKWPMFVSGHMSDDEDCDIGDVDWSALPLLQHMRLGAQCGDDSIDNFDAELSTASVQTLLSNLPRSTVGICGPASLVQLTCLELGSEEKLEDQQLAKEGRAFAHVLMTLPELAKLLISVSMVEHTEQWVAQGWVRAPALRFLKVNLMHSKSLQPDRIPGIPAAQPNLRQLCHLNVCFTDDDADERAHHILQLTALTSLSVEGVRPLREGESPQPGVVQMLLGISSLQRLCSLTMIGLHVQDPAMVTVVPGQLGSLTSLTIDTCEFEAEALDANMVAFGQLRQLAFENCCGLHKCLRTVAAKYCTLYAFPTLFPGAQLSRLELSFDNLTHEVAEACIQALSRVRSLVLWSVNAEAPVHDYVVAVNAQRAGQGQSVELKASVW